MEDLHRGKIIIRDCGVALQVVQGFESWDLEALCETNEQRIWRGSILLGTYRNIPIVQVVVCGSNQQGSF